MNDLVEVNKNMGKIGKNLEKKYIVLMSRKYW
jgi:hypothetical protein